MSDDDARLPRLPVKLVPREDVAKLGLGHGPPTCTICNETFVRLRDDGWSAKCRCGAVDAQYREG